MNDKALAVIEEALHTAFDAFKDDHKYAKREAPAVLSRVLAALGGEPVLWMVVTKTGERQALTLYEPGHDYLTTCDALNPANAPHRSVPLYAAPPIGEPVAWRWRWEGDGRWHYRDARPVPDKNAEPLYLHPATPIDLAAVRAVAETMNREAHMCSTWGRNVIEWADRLLRAINENPNEQS